MFWAVQLPEIKGDLSLFLSTVKGTDTWANRPRKKEHRYLLVKALDSKHKKPSVWEFRQNVKVTYKRKKMRLAAISAEAFYAGEQHYRASEEQKVLWKDLTSSPTFLQIPKPHKCCGIEGLQRDGWALARGSPVMQGLESLGIKCRGWHCRLTPAVVGLRDEGDKTVPCLSPCQRDNDGEMARRPTEVETLTDYTAPVC